MNTMITIGEAKARIQENRLSRELEWKPLLLVRDQVLAEDIIAPFDSPRFDNSAMDGIAVFWVDVKEVNNGKMVVLKLVGESSAGKPYEDIIIRGEAIRISTGAMVPEGADTVIPQENCLFEKNRVVVHAVKKIGQHVRKKGEEYRKDCLLLHSGKPINPAITGILGSIGVDPVKVYKPPVVTLLITGSELTRSTADNKLLDGEIYDSNQPMLAHYLKLVGVEHLHTVWVKDNTMEVRAAIQHAKIESDVIISTGGISVGPHDHIPEVVKTLDFETKFTRVAQKPGKPFFFARDKDTLYFGLPGNPVSAFILFTYYIFPEIRWYMGRKDSFVQRVGRLTTSISNDRDRSLFLSATAVLKKGDWEIKPLMYQASHKLQLLADVNGFIIIPPHVNYEKEETVLFYFFPWQGMAGVCD